MTVLLLAAGVPATASAADPASPPAETGRRYVVGFDELPADVAEDGRLAGGRVLATNDVLDFAVVRGGPDLPSRFGSEVRYVERDSRVSVALTPDDPRYDEQYGPQHVQAPEAWETTLGDTTASVCVVDTGIRYTHEDLAERWIDGYDFVNDDPDPWDDNGHGTHVTGTAAAGTDNDRGIAGIAQVGILSAKVLGVDGGRWSWVADGIQWCADHGADVISMSLSGPGSPQVIRDAVDYARQSDALLVAAAGNDGCLVSCLDYPAELEGVVAVACTNRDRLRCEFSSSGPEVEIAAPGREVLSSCFGDDRHYCRISGTSMSTPHVSGAAALLASHRPSLSSCEIRDVLASTADDLGIPGRDRYTGHGLLDVASAVDEASTRDPGAACPDEAPVVDVRRPTVAETLQGDATLEVFAASPASTVDSVTVRVEDETVELSEDSPDVWTGTLDTRSLVADGEGSFRLVVEAVDADGRTRTVARQVEVDNDVDVRIREPAPRQLLRGNATFSADVRASNASVEQATLFADGSPIAELQPAAGDRWEATVDTRRLVDGDADRVLFTLRGVDDQGRTEEADRYLEVDNRLSTWFGQPTTGATVDGTTEIRVQAFTPHDDVEQVLLSVDGGPEVDITDSWDGTAYTYTWDTTDHVDESRPADLDVRAVNSTGSEASESIQVTVDNWVDPSVEILDPEQEDTVAGVHEVVVHHASGVGNDTTVELQTPRQGWVDITDSCDASGNCTYLWNTVSEPERSRLLARAEDPGGVDEHRVKVTVVGRKMVENDPVVQEVEDCVEDIKEFVEDILGGGGPMPECGRR